MCKQNDIIEYPNTKVQIKAQMYFVQIKAHV